MACGLFTRWSHLVQQTLGSLASARQRRGTLTVSSDSVSVTPAALIPTPAGEQKSFDHKMESPSDPKMGPHPLVSIILHQVPEYIKHSQVEKFVNTISGVVRLRLRKLSHSRGFFDLMIDFEPGTNIYENLHVIPSHPFITIDCIDLPFQVYFDSCSIEDFRIVSNLRPRLVPSSADETNTNCWNVVLEEFNLGNLECYVCRNEVDGSFSTPCWTCSNPQCYDCIRAQFRGALKDFERFPARCCYTILHPDVAKGILPDAEHKRYKMRVEEWLAKDPLYCPVPTCSAFIPRRTSRRCKEKVIHCPACQVRVCVKCKQQAHAGKSCAIEDPMNNILNVMNKFGYKQCPKCHMAVAKMFGCSHIQCKCGAHWCWECRRAIDICNMDECDGIPGNYDENGEGPWIDNESDLGDGADLADEVSTEDVADAVRDSTQPTTPGMPDVQMSDVGEKDEPTAGGSLPRSTTEVPSHQADTSPDIQLDSYAAHDIVVDDATAQHREQGNVEAVDPESSMSNESAALALTSMATITTPAVEPSLCPARPVNGAPPPEESNATANASEPVDKIEDKVEDVNHDAPSSNNWQSGEAFFGDEPTEEDSMDVWGCVHNFEPASSNKTPRYWMTASVPDWWQRSDDQRHFDCMMCWQPTTTASKPRNVEIEEDGEKLTKSVNDWRSSRRCTQCSLIICRSCRHDMIKAKKK